MNTKILSTLKRGPKKGLTAAQIAERTGFSLNSIRSALSAFQRENAVTVVGTLKAGTGRPSNLYTIA